MRVLQGIERVPGAAKGAALAIGNFDGVHRGHRALIEATKEAARAARSPAGVMVFDPHPREFFAPGKPVFRLTTLKQQLALFERAGLDLTVVLPFSAAVAGMPARAFIARVLVEALAVSHVVVGYDFLFGKGRDGNAEVLKREGALTGFGVTVVAPVGEGGETFSSSGIRVKLAQGDVRGAAADLGHWWRIGGTVVGGDHRGTGLGFPTANVRLSPGCALKHGIYAVRIYLEGYRYQGAAYLGTRPTFDNGAPVLETFLFDFSGDLYGREIEIELIDYIRGDQAFRSVEALKAQMDKDCAAARKILAVLKD